MFVIPRLRSINFALCDNRNPAESEVASSSVANLLFSASSADRICASTCRASVSRSSLRGQSPEQMQVHSSNCSAPGAAPPCAGPAAQLPSIALPARSPEAFLAISYAVRKRRCSDLRQRILDCNTLIKSAAAPAGTRPSRPPHSPPAPAASPPSSSRQCSTSSTSRQETARSA